MGDIVVLEHEWKEHCARDVLKITLRLENESVLRMVGLRALSQNYEFCVCRATVLLLRVVEETLHSLRELDMQLVNITLSNVALWLLLHNDGCANLVLKLRGVMQYNTIEMICCVAQTIL